MFKFQAYKFQLSETHECENFHIIRIKVCIEDGILIVILQKYKTNHQKVLPF